MNLIEQNLAAQLNILDAVRAAYARTGSERRAYANAMQRRRALITSLVDAYESFVLSIGGTPSEKSKTVAASPICGLLPDSVLAERCAKGLDFYQRLLTNVSKLLQRVKGVFLWLCVLYTVSSCIIIVLLYFVNCKHMSWFF